MTFIYIIGIILCIIAVIFIIDKIQNAHRYDYMIKEKTKLIEDTNNKLDNIINNLEKTENILTKVDNISKNILKFRK